MRHATPRRSATILTLLLPLLTASTAHAAPIFYEIIFTHTGGGPVLASTGGVTFDDALFAPSATIAASDLSLEIPSSPAFPMFSLAGCSPSLVGHVNAAGTAVTALTGSCVEDGPPPSLGADATVDFASDNTGFVAYPSLLLGFTVTYSLVPEPATSWLLVSAFAAFWLRRRGS